MITWGSPEDIRNIKGYHSSFEVADDLVRTIAKDRNVGKLRFAVPSNHHISWEQQLPTIGVGDGKGKAPVRVSLARGIHPISFRRRRNQRLRSVAHCVRFKNHSCLACPAFFVWQQRNAATKTAAATPNAGRGKLRQEIERGTPSCCAGSRNRQADHRGRPCLAQASVPQTHISIADWPRLSANIESR